MKKVLILAYDFPPYNSIGAQRPWSWYQYFREFGLYPVVITRQWNGDLSVQEAYCSSGVSDDVIIEKREQGEIHYVPYNANMRDRQVVRPGNRLQRLVGKTFTALQVLTENFSFILDNKRNIYRHADQLLREQPVDYILASGEPFVLFRYASLLSKKYQIPWVGDYRDGWSWNYNRKNHLLRWWLRLHEKHIVSNAKFLTTVSLSFQKKLKHLLPAKQVEVIYNGYFEELFDNIKPEKSIGFTMAFSGTLYPYQPIELLFEALREIDLKDFPQPVRLIFYGMEEQAVQKKRIKEAVQDLGGVHLLFTKRMPQQELINQLAGADLFVLPANPDYPQVYAKAFEYLALHKPILYFRPDASDLDDILNGFPQVYSCTTKEDLISNIKALRIKELYYGINSNQMFSRKHQVKQLADLF
jgi:glycosyltransferase involved in cell wall biosynthesis